MNNYILYSFLLSFFITVLITPIFIKIFSKYKIIDDPKRQNHPGIIHKKPVPRGGGIPLLIGGLIGSIFLIPFTSQTISIIIATVFAAIIGLIDDVKNAHAKDLSPYLRFATNIICAVIVISAGIKIYFITNPFGGIIMLDEIKILSLNIITISAADIISCIWIIWIMNMLNWSKGVDGQMPGIVGFSAVIIGILALKTSYSYHQTDAIISFAIAGSSFAFIIYNFYPAKIFPGYGATSIYLLIAIVSMLSSAKLATALLVMGVPAIDAAFTIARRIFSGKSPFWHDKKHLHHLLLNIGLSQRKIALSYWIFSVILGSISLLLDSKNKLFALIMLVVLTVGALLFLHYISNTKHEKNS